MNDRRPAPPPANGAASDGAVEPGAAWTGAPSSGPLPPGGRPTGPTASATASPGAAPAGPVAGPDGASASPSTPSPGVDPDAPATVGGSAEAHPASTAAAPHAEPHRFDRRMIEALVCPATRAPLAYDARRQELFSRAAHLAYPIRDGIPIMLVHEARETD